MLDQIRTETELLYEFQRFKKIREHGSEYLINIIDLFEDRNHLWIVTNYCEASDDEYEEEEDDGNETDSSKTAAGRRDARDSDNVRAQLSTLARKQSMDFGDYDRNNRSVFDCISSSNERSISWYYWNW